MLLDKIAFIYALMYKCIIKIVVIIEEVKKSDRVQGLSQSPWVSYVSAHLVSKTLCPLSSLLEVYSKQLWKIESPSRVKDRLLTSQCNKENAFPKEQRAGQLTAHYKIFRFLKLSVALL